MELSSFRSVVKPDWLEYPSLAFSPDGKTLAYRGMRWLSLWDVGGNRPIELDVVKTETDSNAIYPVSFSRDGRRLATPVEGGVARVYDVEGNRLKEFAVLECHEKEVTGLSLAPDGQTLATAGLKRGIMLWDLRLKPPVQRVLNTSHFVTPDPVTVSPGGVAIIGFAAEKSFDVWDLGGAEVRLIEKVESNSDRIAISARHVIAVGEGDTIVVFSVQEGRLERRGVLKGHTGRVNCLNFSMDGRSLVSSADEDPFVRLWYPEDLSKKRSAYKPVPATSCGWPFVTGSGRWVGARRKDDGSFQIWSPRSCDDPLGRVGSPDSEYGFHLKWEGPASEETYYSSFPEYDILVAKCENQAVVWDISGNQPRSWPAFRMPVDKYDRPRSLAAMCRTAEGKVFAALPGNGDLVVLDCSGPSPKEVARLEGDVSFPHFSPDGTLLVMTSLGPQTSIRVWDVAAKENRYECTLPVRADVSFAPDSRHLITRNENGTAYVLRLRDGAIREGR